MSNNQSFNNSFQNQDNLLIESTTCLWCGNKADFRMYKNGYQADDVFKIYCCESCNTSFSLPRVNSNSVYELIYKNVLNVKGYDRYQKYQEKVLTKKNPLAYLMDAESSYWAASHAIQNILNLDKNARILEVGSGLGYFTYSLKNAGYNIQGLDISQEAVDNAKTKFGDFYICADLFNFADKNIESFDLVIMTEVIEHLNEPKEFIIAINKLLKPNAAFIFTTPNKSFYPNNISWYTDAPPVHCWWFSEQSVQHIATTLNFKFEFVCFDKYFKKHPYISKLVNLDAKGEFVFDLKGNVNVQNEIKSKNFEMPKWVKKIRMYSILRNFLFVSLYPKLYKSGGVQSNVICAILYKNN